MSFEISKQEKFSLVKSKSEKLDSTIAPILKSEFLLLNNSGERNVIIDLSETRYCDSSGLSAILVGNRLCGNSEGTFILTGLQPSVKKLISISQLDTILKITPTLNEAVDMLFMEEIERNLEENV
jgi:anti-sigma B factor antagonist